MVQVQTILKRFEAEILRGLEIETVAHKQRVERWNKTLINGDNWGPRNWHIQFENNGHYGSTG